MVIVQNGEYAVENRMVDLSYSDIHAEDCVYEGKDQVIDQLPQRGSDALSVVEARSMAGRLSWSLVRRRWEVWFYKAFTF